MGLLTWIKNKLNPTVPDKTFTYLDLEEGNLSLWVKRKDGADWSRVNGLTEFNPGQGWFKAFGIKEVDSTGNLRVKIPGDDVAVNSLARDSLVEFQAKALEFEVRDPEGIVVYKTKPIKA